MKMCELGSVSESKREFRDYTGLVSYVTPNWYFSSVNIINTTKCPACDYKTETVAHVIGHCPAYSQIRADFFQTYHTNTDTYLSNTDSLALLDMLLRQKGS